MRAIAEVFWALARESVTHLLCEQGLPDSIHVAREGIAIPVSTDDWNATLAEFGLFDPESRGTVRWVLRNCLYEDHGPQNRRVVCDSWAQESIVAVGLAITASFLSWRSRTSDAGRFRYEYGDLSRHVPKHLDWAGLSRFDEPRFIQSFFWKAGLSLDKSGDLWRLPYVAFVRPLQSMKPNGSDCQISAEPPKFVDDLPTDFLAKAVHSDAEPPSQLDASVGDSEKMAKREQTYAIHDLLQPERQQVSSLITEIRRLATENDQLRGEALPLLIECLLGPFLRYPGELELLAAGSEPIPQSLANEITGSLSAVLRLHEVSFFGQPGEQVAINLPCRDYCLADRVAIPVGDRMPRTFEVVSRGLQTASGTLIPARVKPARRK